MQDFETYLGTVAASSWPRAMQSERDEFVSYHWAATLSEPLTAPVESIEDAVCAAADEGVRKAESEAGMKPSAMRSRVRLRKIDDIHILVRVDVEKEDRVNSWLVASSWALRALDERAAIADLQGIPRRYWLILRGS